MKKYEQIYCSKCGEQQRMATYYYDADDEWKAQCKDCHSIFTYQGWSLTYDPEMEEDT
jgi:formylmethanofuran dehydrogenase subunit E